VSSVADIAWNYIGIPYVWGGTDTSGFDCSGLTQYCYAQAGYSIGRDTYAQAANISAKGQTVYSMSNLSAGDLVFPHSGHVGIYEGGGMMIHAPSPGDYVKYASVYAFSFGGCPV
jgi:cell wall-associated NlpC family hydrolase